MDVPPIAAEAVVGGAWQVLHYYIENNRIDELPAAAPQMTYMLLIPFLGPKQAAEVALQRVRRPKATTQAGGSDSA